MRDNLEDALRELAEVQLLLGELEVTIGYVLWPPTRRTLMTLKDDIHRGLGEVRTKVTAERDVKKALMAQVAGHQAQTEAMLTRISELEQQPGPWTDADMAEIKAAIDELNTSLDPVTVTEAVLAGTPSDTG